MGALDGPNQGNQGQTSRVAHVGDEVEIPAGNVLFTKELIAENLPILNLWIRQTAGAVGATVRVQISKGLSMPNVQDWASLIPDFILISGSNTPTRFDVPHTARRVRLQITAPAGNDVVLDYRLAGMPG